jgi:hypothetical protein
MRFVNETRYDRVLTTDLSRSLIISEFMYCDFFWLETYPIQRICLRYNKKTPEIEKKFPNALPSIGDFAGKRDVHLGKIDAQFYA